MTILVTGGGDRIERIYIIYKRNYAAISLYIIIVFKISLKENYLKTVLVDTALEVLMTFVCECI